MYTKSTKVVHLKAQSSKQNRYHSNIASYYSKLYYHKKYDGKVVFYVLIPIVFIASVIKLFGLIHALDNIWTIAWIIIIII